MIKLSKKALDHLHPYISQQLLRGRRCVSTISSHELLRMAIWVLVFYLPDQVPLETSIDFCFSSYRRDVQKRLSCLAFLSWLVVVCFKHRFGERTLHIFDSLQTYPSLRKMAWNLIYLPQDIGHIILSWRDQLQSQKWNDIKGEPFLLNSWFFPGYKLICLEQAT
jgi:hypothetical protein